MFCGGEYFISGYSVGWGGGGGGLRIASALVVHEWLAICLVHHAPALLVTPYRSSSTKARIAFHVDLTRVTSELQSEGNSPTKGSGRVGEEGWKGCLYRIEFFHGCFSVVADDWCEVGSVRFGEQRATRRRRCRHLRQLNATTNYHAKGELRTLRDNAKAFVYLKRTTNLFLPVEQ